MQKSVILGNIITMDARRPTAKAAFVKDGKFAYIGDADEAKKLAGDDAKILDYGENFVYPGFLEAHCHPYLAGDRAVGQANLLEAGIETDYAKYREIIKEFIAKNPQREVYVAGNWNENDEYVTSAYLDEICSDKPLIMHTSGGHSMLLNTKALEWAGIDAAYAKKMGYDQVHVDKDGNPDGYICEVPVFHLASKLPSSVEYAKEYLLAWQDIAFKNGYTAVGDAGVIIPYAKTDRAYYELEQEGKLKLRTYGYMYLVDNVDNPTAEVARIAEERAKYSGEYFNVFGLKIFLDGVVEAHTGWMIDDYADQPGYHGLERFNDHDKVVELLVAADREGFPVHAHSVGNGATKFLLGCIADAEKITGDLDQRNVLAHLQYVTDEDIKLMGKTSSVPAVAPLWVGKEENTYKMDVDYIGQEMADHNYPIKSFFDAGANVVFHSDYPVSPNIDAVISVFMAETRAFPKAWNGGPESERNIAESITREQSLRALTINVARQFKQEHRLGSIEFGKIANMTVCSCDFLHDAIEKIETAKIVATLVDGEEVYKA